MTESLLDRTIACVSTLHGMGKRVSGGLGCIIAIRVLPSLCNTSVSSAKGEGMSCDYSRSARMLHLLTAVPEGVWGRYLDVARRHAPSPPPQPTPLAEQLLPATPDESHAHATRTAFLLALALAARPRPTPAWELRHAGPRIVALAHALIANASVLCIPPAPEGLLWTIRSEVNAIARATHNQSDIPSALDTIGSILNAVQRGDRDTAATMVTKYCWKTDARM